MWKLLLLWGLLFNNLNTAESKLILTPVQFKLYNHLNPLIMDAGLPDRDSKVLELLSKCKGDQSVVFRYIPPKNPNIDMLFHEVLHSSLDVKTILRIVQLFDTKKRKAFDGQAIHSIFFAQNKEGHIPLYAAFQDLKIHDEVVLALIDCMDKDNEGINAINIINVKDDYYDSLLARACFYRSGKIIERLLVARVSQNPCDPHFFYLLSTFPDLSKIVQVFKRVVGIKNLYVSACACKLNQNALKDFLQTLHSVPD